MLRANTELSKAQLRLFQATNDMKILMLQINNLLNINLDNKINIKGRLKNIDIISSKDVFVQEGDTVKKIKLLHY